MQGAAFRLRSITGRRTAIAAAGWLCFVAVQLLWLYPSSVFSKMTLAELSFIGQELAGSYISYFLLWFCALAQALLVLRVVGQNATREMASLLLLFPLLLIWDALFSLYPGYPVERVNLLLLSWNSAIVCFLLMRHLRVGCIAQAIPTAVVGLETVTSLLEWNPQDRLSGGFGNPLFFYPLLVYGLAIAASGAVSTPTLVGQVGWSVLAIVFSVGLVANATRAGIIACAVVVIYLIYNAVWGRLDVRHPRPVIVTLLLVGILLMVGWHRRAELANTTLTQERSALSRPVLWWAGWRVTLATHGLGCGLENYANAQSQLTELILLKQSMMPNEPHHLFLGMLAIYGTGGLLYLCYFLSASWKLSSNRCGNLRIAGRAILLATIVMGMSDTVLFIPQQARATFFFLQWWFFALIPATESATSQNRAPLPSKHLRLFMKLTALVFLMAAAGVMYTYSAVAPYRSRLDLLERRHVLPLSHYPPEMIRMLIAREDRNFYSHRGVDWRGVHRALRANLRTLRYAQGGSTITQQMVRVLVLDPAIAKRKSILRKMVEMWLAIEAERRLSKTRILELYLPTVIEPLDLLSSSEKDVARLSVAEMATFVGWLPVSLQSEVDFARTVALRNAVLSALDEQRAVTYSLAPLQIVAPCQCGVR